MKSSRLCLRRMQTLATGGMLCCLMLCAGCATPEPMVVTKVVRLTPPAHLLQQEEIPPFQCRTNGDVWRRMDVLETLVWRLNINMGALQIWASQQKGATPDTEVK